MPADVPPAKAAAELVRSTAASISVAVPRHTELRVALGVRPRDANPVPVYYSAIGGLLAAEVVPPIGLRAGLSFYPAGYNDWLPLTDTRFDGVSGDFDVLLSAARSQLSGLLPFIGLGGRVTHMTPRDPAAKPAATYSLSLLLGARIAGGLAIETRYPLLGPAADPPAHFETTLGFWWSI